MLCILALIGGIFWSNADISLVTRVKQLMINVGKKFMFVYYTYYACAPKSTSIEKNFGFFATRISTHIKSDLMY